MRFWERWGWFRRQPPAPLSKHRCSEVSDGMGGFMCVCGEGSYSHIYGCIYTDPEDLQRDGAAR